MTKECTIRFDMIRGFGVTEWLTCPICWNAMKSTRWEDGAIDEECLCCERREFDMELREFLNAN